MRMSRDHLVVVTAGRPSVYIQIRCGNFTVIPNAVNLRIRLRAVILSHLYADPANRAKLRSLAGLGVSLAVAVPDRWATSDGRSHGTEWGDDTGVRIVPIPVHGRVSEPSRLHWNAKTLRRLLTDFRPDLLHIEEEPWTQPAALSLRLARRLRLRSVLSTAESLPRNLSLGQRFRRDRSLRHASGVIGANRLALTLATKRRPTVPQVTLPQIGVTPPPPVPRVPHAGLAIGFVGRLVPERGLDLLFRACVGLTGKWTLTVIGTGPSQEELETLAERLGISARVSWLGALPRQAVDDVWPRLDCVVFPARTTPRWVASAARGALHAMANGVAVVGSDSGALPEIVGDAGRIVPEEDVPALAAVLQELYADRAECERLGAAGRRRIMDEFSDAAIAGKTLGFWRSLTPATG
jgi:glycosyltransferase involved in cell wall biosynthesis